MNWQGRIDSEDSGPAWRWHQRIRPLGAAPEQERVTRSDAPIALLGFCSDEGVRRNAGRVGAAAGPYSLRRALANVPVSGTARLVDAGDVQVEGEALEAAQNRYAETLAGLLARGYRPIGMGGGHEIAIASFQGLAQHVAGLEPRRPRIGVLNFDAHFDLRSGPRATSGTSFRQIAEDCARRDWPFHYAVFGVSRFANTEALFTRARDLGALFIADEQLGPTSLDSAEAALRDFLGKVDHVYLSICLDVLPPGVAPGVSAPSSRGVGLEIIEPLIDCASRSGLLRVADVAELSPAFDPDGRTARVAARLVARIAADWST